MSVCSVNILCVGHYHECESHKNGWVNRDVLLGSRQSATYMSDHVDWTGTMYVFHAQLTSVLYTQLYIECHQQSAIIDCRLHMHTQDDSIYHASIVSHRKNHNMNSPFLCCHLGHNFCYCGHLSSIFFLSSQISVNNFQLTVMWIQTAGVCTHFVATCLYSLKPRHVKDCLYHKPHLTSPNLTWSDLIWLPQLTSFHLDCEATQFSSV